MAPASTRLDDGPKQIPTGGCFFTQCRSRSYRPLVAAGAHSSPSLEREAALGSKKSGRNELYCRDRLRAPRQATAQESTPVPTTAACVPCWEISMGSGWHLRLETEQMARISTGGCFSDIVRLTRIARSARPILPAKSKYTPTPARDERPHLALSTGAACGPHNWQRPEARCLFRTTSAYAPGKFGKALRKPTSPRLDE